MTFRLTMHPGCDGDCIQLTWGTTTTLHHLIVDLGRSATYTTVKSKLADLVNIELFVMSHIDADHIVGAIPMLRKDAPLFMPKRVWYNSRPQLVAAQTRSPILEPVSHPDRETIARYLVANKAQEKTLFFNYRQPNTDVWDSAVLKVMWHYETVFPVYQEKTPDNDTLEIDV